MNKLIIKMINDYRESRPADHVPRCKYHPTCSEYGLECYKRFNFFKATALTTWRILRCNPFSKGGYDPVPEKKIKQKKKEETK